MSSLINLFPSLLLGFMIVLTLVLLPLLNDDHVHSEERQRTDKIRQPKT
ncbi:MAG: hypothetical protein HGA65_11160 [Oscillochloris sp.]|nr:hypothetical protein [Oscillochloris sp.]